MSAEWKQPCWNIIADPGGPFACVLTWCCPCVTYGINVSKLGDAKADVMCSGQFTPACCLYCCMASVGCACIAHIPTRKYIRTKYGIKEPQHGLLEDLLMTWCCSCCAIIQDYNEIAAAEGATKGVVLTDLKAAAAAAEAEAKKELEAIKAPAPATMEAKGAAKDGAKADGKAEESKDNDEAQNDKAPTAKKEAAEHAAPEEDAAVKETTSKEAAPEEEVPVFKADAAPEEGKVEVEPKAAADGHTQEVKGSATAQ